MELRQKCARLALALTAIGALVAAASPAQKALGWTSTAGSVSAFLGTGQVNPVAVEVDANGNIYTAGRVNNSADFDPSPSTAYTLTPTGSSFTGFITKLNSDGELVWAGLINSSGASQVTDISIDSSGNVLVIGHFSGTADLDPGAGTLTVQSSSSGFLTNLFAIRLTPAGVVTWSHTLPALSYAYSSDVDSSDNFVITGEFAGTNVDFDPGAGTDTLSNGSNGVFVWSINSSGTHRWVKRATGTYTNSKAVAADSSGNVYVCGTYQGSSTDFDPGAGFAYADPAGGQDFYLWSLDSSGNYRWATTFGNSSGESCTDLDASASGNVIVSGSFYTSIDIGRDGSNEVTAVSGEDQFFGLFNSSGVNQWIYGRDSVGSYVHITGSSVWATGQFFGTVDFNPDGAITDNLVSRGSADAFVIEFNLSGVYQRGFRFGGSSGMESANRMLISNGEIYVAGYFGSTPSNFNTGNGTAVNVSATGTFSGFVNKLTSLGEVIVPPTTTTTTTTTTIAPSTTTTAAPSTTAPTVTSTVAPGVASTSTTVARVTPGSSGNGSSNQTPTTVATITDDEPSTADSTTTTTPDPDTPDVTTVNSGEVGATVDGKPEVVTLKNDNGSIVATVGGATISYSVESADGTQRPLSVESFSSIQTGDRIVLKFSGFADSGKSRAWIAPTGVKLGEGTLAGGSGTVEGIVPSTVQSGDVRVVASADSQNGESVVVAYGVTLESGSSGSSPWPLLLVLVVGLAILGALVVPAVRRRRIKS